jgi:outer membrane protein assembly factor BamB
LASTVPLPAVTTRSGRTFYCLDGRTGRLRWYVTLPTGLQDAGITFDDDNIYVLRAYSFSCVSKRERRVIWSKDHSEPIKPVAPWRQTLILPTYGIACWSAATGERVWNLAGDVNSAPVTLRDDTAYAAYTQKMSGGRQFLGLDPASGKILWRHDLFADV